MSIPDASLRLYLSDLSSEPPLNTSFPAFPSVGLHADDPTPELPLVDVGTASETIGQNLTGKGALITDTNSAFPFLPALDRVTTAGAAFAVVFNSPDSSNVIEDWLKKRLEFARIPVVLVPSAAGQTLKDYIITRPQLRAQLRSTPAIARFAVDEPLLCEHVGVRVRTTHPSRQDLRITLVSPQGTRSILQTINNDQSAGPVDWTYYSVHHFYEAAAGVWTLEVTDEVQGLVGALSGADLIIEGIPLLDLDEDALDDTWELANFLNLGQSGLDDPDGDGSWNAREQALRTNPALNQTPFTLVTSIVQSNAVRVAFPSVDGANYLIRTGTNLNQSLQDIATIRGDSFETEFTSDLLDAHRFFQVRKAQ